MIRNWRWIAGLISFTLIVASCASTGSAPILAPAPEPTAASGAGSPANMPDEAAAEPPAENLPAAIEASPTAAPPAEVDVQEIVVTAQKLDAYRVRGGTAFENRRQSVDLDEKRERGQFSGAGRQEAYFGPPGELPFVGDEEIWVIAKAENPDSQAPAASETDPGTGSMLAIIDDRELPLPLQHTGVSADIRGYISTVDVRQQFANPYDSKIEAVYLFPLPEKAAVSEFLMIIGERRIRGILREKEEARRIYTAARDEGYRASLLEQLRPNVFEQKVANIEPGASIDVEIRYFHTLAYRDGWYSFVFPTVVGPRFNPPHSKDPIGAVSATDTTTRSPAVRYLRPEQRSGHDISIEVSIDAGVTIESLRSTHTIASSRDAVTAKVRLADGATIPNRDFILDFRVAGETIKSGMLTHTDPRTGQGYFTLMLIPPRSDESLPRQSMEMVFVLDSSGSMNGTPMRQAKDAVRAALDLLQPGDTFQIIRFSDDASQFGPVPVAATRANIATAKRYLDELNGSGGTMMIEGIRAALDFPHDPERYRFVSFLTDGYIGNETEILGAIHQRLGASRIFSFGVGSSVNRYLLERMAGIGRGAAAFLGPQDSGSDVMRQFFDRISHPALVDVDVDWNGMAVEDVYPQRLPDLFVGRPLVITGRFSGAAAPVTVRSAHEPVATFAPADDRAGDSLAKIWARLRIAELVDRRSRVGYDDGEIAASIRRLALAYQLLSDYTSFVAVDASARTAGDHGTTVHQAVPVPAGVRYDTTVGAE